MGCSCTKLTAEELSHFLLLGDKRKDQIDEDLAWCVSSGLLEENRGK